jgi:predicted ArsR family transcriptional regulator
VAVPLDPLHAVARLADPVRRRLYEFVASRTGLTSREAAAEATGVSRSLAAYHLDKLAADGLLETAYARTGRRTGPGAGRTAKLYRRSDTEVAVNLPPRDYERAAQLLAAALESDPSGAARAGLMAGAREVGQGAADAVRDARGGDPLVRALRDAGYEPFDSDGEIRLRNCPFHHLAEGHRDLICSMNHALIDGMLQGLPATGRAARLDPRPGCCCVAIAPAGSPDALDAALEGTFPASDPVSAETPER